MLGQTVAAGMWGSRRPLLRCTRPLGLLLVRRNAVTTRTERARPARLRRRSGRRLLRLLRAERALLLVLTERRLFTPRRLTATELPAANLTATKLTTANLAATAVTTRRFTATGFTATGLTATGLTATGLVVVLRRLLAVRALVRLVAVPRLLWLLRRRWGRRSRQVRRLRDVRLLGHRAAFVGSGRVRQRRRRVETEAVGPVPPGVVVVVRAAVLLGCPVLRSGPVRRRQFVVVLGTGRQEVVNHAVIVPPLRRVSATACG
ncbi:hypothetical protein [Kribbella swartbergensis]